MDNGGHPRSYEDDPRGYGTNFKFNPRGYGGLPEGVPVADSPWVFSQSRVGYLYCRTGRGERERKGEVRGGVKGERAAAAGLHATKMHANAKNACKHLEKIPERSKK